LTKAKKGQKHNQSDSRATTFFRIVEEKLRPLLDEYRLRRTRVENGGGYSYYTIIFQNEHAAVRVYFEWRERYLSVQVCRLVDGKVQNDPESLDVEWTCFHVEDLLTVVAPEYDQSELWLPNDWQGENVLMSEIGQRLEKYAVALRMYAGNVLQGDFMLFPQLDRIAKQRAKDRGAL
jgi:hypothetical protein